MATKGSGAASSGEAARQDGFELGAAQKAGTQQSRSQLSQSESFLTSMVESMPAVVFVKDSVSGRFILLNRAGEEFLGVPRAAIVGKTDHDFFPKEEADRFVARDRRALQSRQPQIIDEEPVHTPHNGIRCLRTKIIAVRDGADRPLYLLGISEDITEQKLAGDRIRYMAHHDGLTSLANRASFRQQLDAAMTEFRRSGRRDRARTSSISTASRGSTTRSAIRSATRCCKRSRAADATASATAIWSRAWAAMSSPSSRSMPAAGQRAHWRRASSRSMNAPLRPRRPSGGHRRQHRHRAGADATARPGPAAEERRPCAVPGQGRRPRHATGSSSRAWTRTCRSAGARAATCARRSPSGEFELHYQPLVSWQTASHRGFEALLRWRHPSAAWSRRPSSSRSPRRPA